MTLAPSRPQWGVHSPCRLPVPRRPVHPATVITLYTFPGTGELESVSPFCMKVECYLKLQKVPYETRAGDPRKAPKGKMPFIAVGDATIADSSVIVDFLEQKSDRPLDHGLSVAGRAQAHLLKAHHRGEPLLRNALVSLGG